MTFPLQPLCETPVREGSTICWACPTAQTRSARLASRSRTSHHLCPCHIDSPLSIAAFLLSANEHARLLTILDHLSTFQGLSCNLFRLATPQRVQKGSKMASAKKHECLCTPCAYHGLKQKLRFGCLSIACGQRHFRAKPVESAHWRSPRKPLWGV